MLNNLNIKMDSQKIIPPNWELTSQVVNWNSGLICVLKIQNNKSELIIYPLFQIFPIDDLKLYTYIPDKWLIQSELKDFQNWKVFSSDKFKSGIILKFNDFSYFANCVVVDNNHGFVNFSLNFPKKPKLDIFINNVRFVKIYTKLILYINSTKIKYEIIIDESEFQKVYNNIIKKYNSNCIIDINDLMVDNKLFVKDDIMKNKIEYLKNIQTELGSWYYQKINCVEKDLNNLNIHQIYTGVTINYSDENVKKIRSDFNYENDFQIFRNKNKIYFIKKWISESAAKQYLLDFKGEKVFNNLSEYLKYSKPAILHLYTFYFSIIPESSFKI
jgi:hypothetical protein